MKTNFKRIAFFRAIYSIIALILTVAGYYLIKHYLPSIISEESSYHKHLLSLEIVLFTLGFYFFFKWTLIKWRPKIYFFTGLLIILFSFLLFSVATFNHEMANVPGYEFYLNFNEIDSVATLFSGIFLFVQGWLLEN